MIRLFQRPLTGRSSSRNFNRQLRINWVLGALCVAWTGLLIGCNKSETTSTLGDWKRGSDLEGVARIGGVSFVIGNIAYIGTGVNSNGERLNDFWAYNAERNTWTQPAAMTIGAARAYGVGFAVGTKGYVGTGTNINGDRLNDFYEYDQTANTWKRIADFGGTGRYGAVAFAAANKGYVGCGNDGNYLKDFWSYNPTTAAWTKVASYGGSKRVGAAGFVINNIAYVGTGDNNGTSEGDWWAYDPAQDLWTAKNNFSVSDNATVARSNGVGFAVGNYGYITLGTVTDRIVWQYDPTADKWSSLGVFEGTARQYAIGFAINGKGYVTTGGTSSGARYDDVWIFDPTVAQNTDTF
jgi:N-acetylneuraminic acid mutarotase